MTLIFRTEKNVKLNSNPILNPTPADIGTVGIHDRGTESDFYQKVGAAHNAWRLIKTVPSGSGNLDDTDLVRDEQFQGSSSPVATSQKYDIITISNTDLVNGVLNLSEAPDVTKPIMVFPEGGLKQRLGDAFGISGSQLVINGYGFENFLEANEKIEVYYYPVL